MKASDYLKREIVLRTVAAIKDYEKDESKNLEALLKEYEIEWDGETINESNIDDLYGMVVDQDYHWDVMDDVREGAYETGFDCGGSRHYESKGVAAEFDGKMVAWIYWYGGGKHGEPSAIDWIDDAYFVNVTEETKVVKVFTQIEEPSTTS